MLWVKTTSEHIYQWAYYLLIHTSALDVRSMMYDFNISSFKRPVTSLPLPLSMVFPRAVPLHDLTWESPYGGDRQPRATGPFRLSPRLF